MDKEIHRAYEEILNLLLEKNEKIYQIDFLADEFSALEESLMLLKKKAENLLQIKKSFAKSVQTMQENQRVYIDPVVSDSFKPNFWVFALIGIFIVVTGSVLVSQYSIKDLFLVK